MYYKHPAKSFHAKIAQKYVTEFGSTTAISRVFIQEDNRWPTVHLFLLSEKYL